MDLFQITTPDLYLRPGVMEDSYPLLKKVMRSAGRYQVTKNQEAGDKWATIKIGPGAATHVHVGEDESRWRIKKIRVALPRWLWGHNGRIIADHEELLVALHRFHTVAGLLVEDHDRYRLLPGLGENNRTYWSSIEFPVHVPDPDGRLMEAFMNMRHRESRSRAWIKDSSASLSASGLLIRAYDKERQLGGSSEGKDLGTLTRAGEKFVRLECKWSGEVLHDRLAEAQPKRSERGQEDADLLAAGFSYETLRKSFDAELRRVSGVFVPDKSLKGKHVVPRVLAQIAFTQEIPLENVLATYRAGGFGSPRTAREHEAQARGFFAEKLGLELSDVLKQASSNLFVRSKKAEDQVTDMMLPDGPLPESIRMAFSDENSTSQGPWMPAPPLTGPRGENWSSHLPWPDCLPVLQGVGRAGIFIASKAPAAL